MNERIESRGLAGSKQAADDKEIIFGRFGDFVVIKMAGNVDEDDVDLYEDLLSIADEERRVIEETKSQRYIELEQLSKTREDRILELENELSSVKKENVILKRNISVLYKTAKAEIDRKQFLLAELQRKFDEIVFRRRNKGNGNLNSLSVDIRPSESVVTVSSNSKHDDDVVARRKRLTPPQIEEIGDVSGKDRGREQLGGHHRKVVETSSRTSHNRTERTNSNHNQHHHSKRHSNPEKHRPELREKSTSSDLRSSRDSQQKHDRDGSHKSDNREYKTVRREKKKYEADESREQETKKHKGDRMEGKELGKTNMEEGKLERYRNDKKRHSPLNGIIRTEI